MQKIIFNPKFTKYLFIILAAALDVLAIGSFMRISANPSLAIAYAAYAFLMFAEAALMLVCAFWIRKSPRIYWLAVFLLAANVVSIIFDQIGIVDVIFAIFSGIILFILLINRSEFSPDSKALS